MQAGRFGLVGGGEGCAWGFGWGGNEDYEEKCDFGGVCRAGAGWTKLPPDFPGPSCPLSAPIRPFEGSGLTFLTMTTGLTTFFSTLGFTKITCRAQGWGDE